MRRWLPLFAALALVACGASTEDQARKVWSAYCDRVRECSFSGFIAIFGDQGRCIQRGLDGLPEGSADAKASCSDDELSRCLDEVSGGACPTLDPLGIDRPDGGPLDPRALPAPCGRCSPAGPALLGSEADGGP